MSLRLALIPLDERPVNTRYPQILAAIAGAEVLLPDPEILSNLRKPAYTEKLQEWLVSMSHKSSAAIVSSEMFGYGGLIASRISEESAAEVLTRLNALTEIQADCPVHLFSVITRVPSSDDIVEEPLYWKEWGLQFARFAQLTHRKERGAITPNEQAKLDQLGTTLPTEIKANWLTRRLRNHTVNLGLVDLAARHLIESLLITSDDTSPYGFPSRERDWLSSWRTLIGSPLAERLMMHPGADEVGSALTARLINREAKKQPKVYILYSIPGDEELVAPYEDRPVRETVLGQIEACGCIVTNTLEGSDFVLGVVTPSPRRKDYRLQYFEEDKTTRTGDYISFLEQLAAYQKEGYPVAIADVAYPNGSDPLFIDCLFSHSTKINLAELAAFGAWNTAGNTLGVVIAQGSVSLLIDNIPERQQAQTLFLAHRFLEDYGYQALVRREARAACLAKFGHNDPLPDSDLEQAFVVQFLERRLAEILTELQSHGIGLGLRIMTGSVRLPWHRTFEVDFELEC